MARSWHTFSDLKVKHAAISFKVFEAHRRGVCSRTGFGVFVGTLVYLVPLGGKREATSWTRKTKQLLVYTAPRVADCQRAANIEVQENFNSRDQSTGLFPLIVVFLVACLSGCPFSFPH